MPEIRAGVGACLCNSFRARKNAIAPSRDGESFVVLRLWTTHGIGICRTRATVPLECRALQRSFIPNAETGTFPRPGIHSGYLRRSRPLRTGNPLAGIQRFYAASAGIQRFYAASAGIQRIYASSPSIQWIDAATPDHDNCTRYRARSFRLLITQRRRMLSSATEVVCGTCNDLMGSRLFRELSALLCPYL